jgi:predicted nucleic-acid-binding Zn-ribbon protein
MTDQVGKCAKCGGVTEEGYLTSHGMPVPSAGEWIEGVPVPSLWFGTRTHGKEKIEVGTMRCMNCGHLELYARNIFEEDIPGAD